MVKISFLLLGLTTGVFGDDIDWKVTFADRWKEVASILTRMELPYFERISDLKIRGAALDLWRLHRAEMLAFLKDKEPVHLRENANDECVQIAQGEIRVSKLECRNLTGEAMQRDLLRELFVMVGAEDILSRHAAKMVGAGWTKNQSKMPPFPIAGKYHLKESRLPWEIDVHISAGERAYQISVDKLPSYQKDRLEFEDFTPGRWRANATNPTVMTKRWTNGESKTFTGKEAIAVRFIAPDQITLEYTDRVMVMEWSATYSGVIQPRELRDHFFGGSKVVAAPPVKQE